MDRCRCAEYKEAVEKLKFFTVGTHRPDIVDNFDRSGYVVTWMKHGVDYEDMKFTKPRAIKLTSPGEPMGMSEDARKIERMWCPYMTPVKR